MFVDALRSFRRSVLTSSVRPRRRHRGGRPQTAVERLERRDLLSAVTFFQKFEGVDWTSAGAGGVGNYAGGDATLSVGDVNGEIVAGYLYWQGIDRVSSGGDGVYDNETVSFDGVQITGVSLGIGGTGGWGAGGSQAFRADVTDLLRTGVQSYSVAGLASKRGHNANGVSLIVVYRDGDLVNDRDLYVLNGNHVSGGAGSEGPWSACVEDFLYRHGDVRAEFHVADGQSFSDSAVNINGTLTVPDRPGLFDGDSVTSMGRGRAINGALWDVNTLDATAAMSGAGACSIDVTQASTSDSLALVVLLFDTSARPLNTPPVASDLSISGREDESVASRLTGSDAEGDPLTFSLVSPPASGRLILSRATGEFTWTPPANWSGTVTFTYRAHDGEDASDIATVTLTLDPVNDPPVVTPPIITADEGSSVAGAISATDVDDAVLSFLLLDGPDHGTLAFADDGSFVYTPDANWHGDDSFTVSVTDGASEPVVAVVPVRVAPMNDAPTAADAQFEVYGNSPRGTFVGKVTAADIDGDALSFAIASGNESGAFAIDPTTGEITVADGGKLDHRTTPEILLAVTVADGFGGIATASVIVTVSAQPVEFRVNLGNDINLRGFRWLPVMIYSTDTFDARQIDLRSVTFGRTGDERSLVHFLGRHWHYYRDVNRDGRLDLVILFDVRRTGLREGDTAATLKGQLNDGTAFAGTVPVVVTDGRKDKRNGKR